MIICVFGDSTAWGAWDLEKGGWVNRLWLFFAKNQDQYDVDVHNLGVSFGGTSKGLLRRFKVEAEAREPDIIIFQGGGNDSAYVNREGNHRVTPKEYEKNLLKLIKLARKFTNKIIFLGFKNIDERKTMPVPWDKSIYYTDENIKRYNDIQKRICQKNKIESIDIFGLLAMQDLADGLHPNSCGHEKIYKRVKSFLINNLDLSI